jgi:AcrR family transcriptional regulator
MPRVDVVRNRARILHHAERLVARNGAEALRIADVARAAGVGAGSIYRSFGSKSGLLLALLDESERALQEELLRGEPPLGPGAPAGERVVAFVLALHQLNVRQRSVLVAADAGSPLARQHTGAHAAWRTHLTILLREAAPAADPEVLAELLLAALAPAVQLHLLDERDVAPQRLSAEVERVTRLLLRE